MNLDTHKRVIREAADVDCELAVFPEMSLTGYLDPGTLSCSIRQHPLYMLLARQMMAKSIRILANTMHLKAR